MLTTRRITRLITRLIPGGSFQRISRLSRPILLIVTATWVLAAAANSIDVRPAAAAKTPPAALLASLDHEVDGEAVVAAAEALLEGYGDHPRAAEAAEILADYRYALGEYKAAARHYATAATLSAGPARVRCLLARGRALLGAGELATARSVFEEVLTLAPRASEARLGMADAALLGGEIKQAVTLYSEMLNASPDDPATPLALAQRLRALDTLGRSDEALADARRLVEDYPRSSEAAAVRDRLRRQQREKAAEAEATPGPSTTTAPPTRRPLTPRAPTGREPTSPPEPPSAEGGYSLQLGAFGSEENAQDLAHRLEELRMPDVRIEKEDRKGRTFYRVRCGSYADPEAAEAEGRRLLEHGLRYQVVAR